MLADGGARHVGGHEHCAIGEQGHATVAQPRLFVSKLRHAYAHDQVLNRRREVGLLGKLAGVLESEGYVAIRRRGVIHHKAR